MHFKIVHRTSQSRNIQDKKCMNKLFHNKAIFCCFLKMFVPFNKIAHCRSPSDQQLKSYLKCIGISHCKRHHITTTKNNGYIISRRSKWSCAAYHITNPHRYWLCAASKCIFCMTEVVTFI
jgi:hypothetical protein